MAPSNRRRTRPPSFGQRQAQSAPNPFFRNATSGIRYVGGRAAFIAKTRLSNAGTRGVNFGRSTIERMRNFSAKEEFAFERMFELREEQRRARKEQLKLRKQTAELKKMYGVEINQIKKELQKIMELLKKNNRAKFKKIGPAVVERIAINLFTKFGKKTRFVLERDVNNKMALKNILTMTENQITQGRINLTNVTATDAQRVEGIINSSIEKTFKKFQEQGIALKV